MKSFNLALLAALAGVAFAQPEINFDSAPNFLKLPDKIYLGEAAGAATNSKGHVFVFTRTGDAYATIGTSRTFTHGGGRLFEFDQTGAYVREIGVGLYGFLFPESVKVDPQDNIWVVDRGSSLVIKFDPSGQVAMVMGRKPEAITVGTPGRGAGAPGAGRGADAPAGRGGAEAPAAAGRGAGGGRGPVGPGGTPGDLFGQPTDVAWDAAGNIYVADGYRNSRIAKYDKNGKWIKGWGIKGAELGQLDVPHSIALDAQGNVYVAELGNKRIQVFDGEGTSKRSILAIGTPRAICIAPGAHQYLYSSNSSEPTAPFDNGEIYKLELDGTIVGKFGHGGKAMKEFGTVNSIDCRKPNELIVGETTNWRVQKLTLK